MRGLINIFRKRGIAACEAKAQQLGAKRWKCADIGSGSVSRWGYMASTIDNRIDFNTEELPYPDGRFPLVVCEQVIEHLHNTTFFLRELNRITEFGGRVLISTENLASIPNIMALLCQRTAFSTHPVCGEYLGGFNDRSRGYQPSGFPINHPCYSGVNGHVRVMTVSQLRELFKRAGFMEISKHGFALNHYVLFELRKVINLK